MLLGDLAIDRREQVATVNFDARAIGSRRPERPFRDGPVTAGEVSDIIPADIRHRLPSLLEGRLHSFPADVAGAKNFRPAAVSNRQSSVIKATTVAASCRLNAANIASSTATVDSLSGCFMDFCLVLRDSS
jgi:hypothetical protein